MKSICAKKKKLILSSKSRIFKTEQFIKQTAGAVDVDLLLRIIHSALILELRNNEYYTKSNRSFIVQTIDGNNKLFFKLGQDITQNKLSKNDIVFYKYVGQGKISRRGDRRFVKYVSSHENADVLFNLNEILEEDKESIFNKLYIIANSDNVNFPLLNEEQKKIVKMEDNNILVQGVAGSGKTNICIDKIVYCATRHYKGKCLYSTYSHGLLEETKKRVSLFCYNIENFINKYNQGEVDFVDSNIKLAIENYLGITIECPNDKEIFSELSQISRYLSINVDYFLIEDLYSSIFSNKYKVANEGVFVNEYLKNIKNYSLLNSLEKIKYLSNEIIYKEIYGAIFGFYNKSNVYEIISKEDYCSLRENSFSKEEAQTIYSIALDYLKFLRQNNYIDNNEMAREIILKASDTRKYSLVVLDEVQDFTQINLAMFKNIAIKMCCVGDVLQMINPSYFSFAFLKNIMFTEGLIDVVSLKNNYRNNDKIEKIVNSLSQINIDKFGLHKFVLKGNSIKDEVSSSAIYVNDGNFVDLINKGELSNLTIVVNSLEKKLSLRKKLPKQEILTISEIKGLERNSVILVDVLSDNYEKWNYLQKSELNKKKAEENSVYRYYFNLLYVGITRAKQNLLVNERKEINMLSSFINGNFEVLSAKESYKKLLEISEKENYSEDDIYDRVEEFIRLEQYDNARWTAQKITNIEEQRGLLTKIDINEKYVRNRLHRQAGIEFWKAGFFKEAKEQFVLSNDLQLLELVDACINNNGQKLEYDIVQFYPSVADNEVAKKLIEETLINDIKDLKDKQKQLNETINKKMKKVHYGKH